MVSIITSYDSPTEYTSVLTYFEEMNKESTWENKAGLILLWLHLHRHTNVQESNLFTVIICSLFSLPWYYQLNAETEYLHPMLAPSEEFTEEKRLGFFSF